MSSSRHARLLATLLAVAVLTGGWARAPLATPILESSAQAQCAWLARGPAVRIFDSAAQWQGISSATQKPALAKTPDWQQQVVIAVTLGARPSSGYEIDLASKQFELRKDTLWLDFRERGPAAGEIHAQALTQPCVFMLVERGKWQSVALRNADTDLTLRAELAR